jgi:hypothetical protein
MRTDRRDILPTHTQATKVASGSRGGHVPSSLAR